MGEVCFPIEMELKSGKQGEGCLSQCKIVCHLQPQAGDPDLLKRKFGVKTFTSNLGLSNTSKKGGVKNAKH